MTVSKIHFLQFVFCESDGSEAECPSQLVAPLTWANGSVASLIGRREWQQVESVLKGASCRLSSREFRGSCAVWLFPFIRHFSGGVIHVRCELLWKLKRLLETTYIHLNVYLELNWSIKLILRPAKTELKITFSNFASDLFQEDTVRSSNMRI
jgi:hypothetical protein